MDGYKTTDPAIISIHALTRSATSLYPSETVLDLDFNPRTHEECDVRNSEILDPKVIISIHALTRSATTYLDTFESYETISIHALTRSATL